MTSSKNREIKQKVNKYVSGKINRDNRVMNLPGDTEKHYKNIFEK